MTTPGVRVAVTQDKPQSSVVFQNAAHLAEHVEAHRVAQAKLRLKSGAAWHDQGLVFPNTIGRPFEPRLVHTKFKKILADAGKLLADAGKPLASAGICAQKFHNQRHTAFTTLLEHGTDLFTVSRMAGHSSINTTANVYAHWTDKMKQTLTEKLNAIAAEGRSQP